MGNATRDYIPAGEDQTDAEKKRSTMGRMIRTGANAADFIPEAGYEGAAKVSDPEARRDKAQAAAVEFAKGGQDREYAYAQERLKVWNVSQAVDAIGVMPVQVRDMYVAAETVGAHRVSILKQFPPIGSETIRRFAPDYVDAVPEPQAGAGTETPQAEAD